jgi:hypothetical protein
VLLLNLFIDNTFVRAMDVDPLIAQVSFRYRVAIVTRNPPVSSLSTMKSFGLFHKINAQVRQALFSSSSLSAGIFDQRPLLKPELRGGR